MAKKYTIFMDNEVGSNLDLRTNIKKKDLKEALKDFIDDVTLADGDRFIIEEED